MYVGQPVFRHGRKSENAYFPAAALTELKSNLNNEKTRSTSHISIFIWDKNVSQKNRKFKILIKMSMISMQEHPDLRDPDQVWIISFNEEIIYEFFAQVQLVHSKDDITQPWQIFSLDETGFSPGCDLSGKSRRRVMTAAKHRAACAKVDFSYHDRITLLSCVNASGEYFTPCTVLKGFGSLMRLL